MRLRHSNKLRGDRIAICDASVSQQPTVTMMQPDELREALALLPAFASKLAGSSQASKAALRAGHSLSSIENQAVSRFWPFTTMCWRKMPSKVNPKRRAARREGVLFSVALPLVAAVAQGLRRHGGPSGTWLPWRRWCAARGREQDVADLDDAVGRIHAHVAGVAADAASHSRHDCEENVRSIRSAFPRAPGADPPRRRMDRLQGTPRPHRGRVQPARGQQNALQRSMAPALRIGPGASAGREARQASNWQRLAGFDTKSAYQPLKISRSRVPEK